MSELFTAADLTAVKSIKRKKMQALRDKNPNRANVIAVGNKELNAIKKKLGADGYAALMTEAAKTNDLSKGGKPTKKDIPVIAISVGMGKMKKPEKKTAMMRGGMANGKEHMYAAGGSVNDGLKALAKTRPDVVAKILK